MKPHVPTQSEIDELIGFLPKLYAEGFEAVKVQSDAIFPKNGVIEVSPPVYDQQVSEFFRIASKEAWRDAEYLSKDTGEMLQNPGFIKSASMAEVQSMLTHCVRAERFCDGYWESVLNGGQLRLILMRLMELRSALIQ
jgi:hypothetical protein